MYTAESDVTAFCGGNVEECVREQVEKYDSFFFISPYIIGSIVTFIRC